MNNNRQLKIIIILIQGGLGNQMFGYAFYLAMRRKYPNSIFLFKISNHVNQHNGLELFDIFNISGRWRYYFCHPFLFWKSFNHIKQKDALLFDEEIMSTSHMLNYYEGFWQSEKYFKNVEEQTRKSFQFKRHLFNQETILLEKEIKSNNSVSVHIRRGDYLNFAHCAVCDNSYYDRAEQYIIKKVDNPCFYVFSDDIEWCQNNIKTINAKFIGCNTGKDSWQDMYLMSICKHNIIANSTFSWWGAWLNDNQNKIVVSPNQWFIGSDSKDILPNTWIKI